MIFNVILIVILLIGLLTLFWTIKKKLPQLRIVDPESLPETQTKNLKNEIIRKRVERASGRQMKVFNEQVLTPALKGAQNLVRRIAGKLTAVERRYQERKRQSGEVVYNERVLKNLIEDGKKLVLEEIWDRAEKKFIEVIGADPKNSEAYEELGRLYLHKKDLPLAKETFIFLSKLSKDDPSVIASIGEVEEMLGNHQAANQRFKKAVELSPKNPRYLDFYITSSIVIGDVHEAMSILDKLREVNPENKKIEVFEKQIVEIRGKQTTG